MKTISGHKIKPETMAKITTNLKSMQRERTADMQRRLAEKASAEPDGFWGELLAESIERSGDLR